LHAQLAQRVAASGGEVLHVGVREDAVFVVERGRGAPAVGDVAIDEPGRDVELRGQRFPRAHATAPPDLRPRSGTSLAIGPSDEVRYEILTRRSAGCGPDRRARRRRAGPGLV